MRRIPVVVLAAFLTGLTLFRLLDRSEEASRQLLLSEARQALDLLNRIRSYPHEKLPATGLVQAFEAARLRLAKVPDRAFDLDTWEPIGPQNIGGRTLAIALNPQNPNTVYAGSASGGLWRSYSGGVGENAWQRVETGFPVLGVAAIAIAPDDSNTFYIGTGEVYGKDETFPGVVGDRTSRGSYGIGILKTTDGGATWSKSLDWTLDQRTGVQKIRINPLRPASVWAATTEGTFRSYDAGRTWQKVLFVRMATDLAINPVDTSVVFAACGGMGSPGHGLYRTTDGGATWAKMNLGPDGPASFRGKAVLAMAPSDPNIVYASIGKSSGALFTGESTATWLVKTTDGGDTWEVVSTVDYSRIQGWYSHAVAVHPQNPDEVWCAGQRFNPFRSIDGGRTLLPAPSFGMFQPHPDTEARDLPHTWADHHEIVYHPTNPDILYFANDGGVFRSDDGGRTVQNCNLGYQTTQFYNGFSNADGDSLFALGGLQDNGTVVYTGGPDWTRVFGGDGAWTALNQEDGQTVYVSFQFLSVHKNTRRGLIGEFQDVTPPRERIRTNFIAPFVLSPVDSQTLYAGSDVVFKSTNGGENWVPTNEGRVLDGNPMLSMAASHQDVNVVYVATSPSATRAHVFRTQDGGLTWEDVTGDLPDRYPTDLVVDPNSDRNVYITFGGFGTSHVFKSTDAGATWQDIGTDLPDIPAWAIAVDPDFPEHLYLGNEVGVFQSLDGGATWHTFMSGLPDAVFAMDLSVSRANRKLRVATHGNGVYEIRLPAPPTTAVADADTPVPSEVILLQNYPNPFNLETRIRYFLQRTTRVQLRLYNAVGQRVRTLVDSEQPPGWYEHTWDGRDESGQVVASGVYWLRLSTPDKLTSRKVILLK